MIGFALHILCALNHNQDMMTKVHAMKRLYIIKCQGQPDVHDNIYMVAEMIRIQGSQECPGH